MLWQVFVYVEVLKMPKKSSGRSSRKAKKLWNIFFCFVVCLLVVYTWVLFTFLDTEVTGDNQEAPVASGNGEEFNEAKSTPEDEELHIIFNTGCNLFQHWQAQALMASAKAVGQRGWITRIVSGCDYEDTELPDTTMLTHPVGMADTMVMPEGLKKSVFPRFRLHMTPVFEGAKDYPWLNKPQSIEHWIKNAEPRATQRVVAIIDPDFLFVTPLMLDSTDDRVIFSGREEDRPHITTNATKGRPVGQQYGIGAQWVEHAAEVCGKDSPATK